MKNVTFVTALVCLLLIGAVAQAQVAVLDSANTKEFFRRHYDGCPFLTDGDEYQKYFTGWVYLLQQASIPFTIVYDSDVTAGGLSGFKVLILSNTASLSDEQTKAIHNWVTGGGRLLATFGSGYKSTEPDPRQDDGLKQQAGHTFGLHELWHDPATTVFSSFNIAPGVDVPITRFEGPTGCADLQAALAPGSVLPYGAEANIMTQRPENYPGVLGYLQFNNPDWTRPTPAILAARTGRGLVVYYAFAPEFMVSLAFVQLQNPACSYDPNLFLDRANKAMLLMNCTLNWLLNN